MANKRTERRLRSSEASMETLAAIHKRAGNLPADDDNQGQQAMESTVKLDPIKTKPAAKPKKHPKKLVVSCSTRGVEKTLAITIKPFKEVQDMMDSLVSGNKAVAYNYLILKGLQQVVESDEMVILTEDLLAEELERVL